MGDNPKYEKEYDLPYPEAAEYPYKRMSMAERAAQFSAFKALTGYGDAVEEAARRTDSRIGLDDRAAGLLNMKMQILREHIGEEPEITVVCFVPDGKKAGGKYDAVSGRVKRIDGYKRILRFSDDRVVPLDDILTMEGEVFGILSQNEAEWD